MRKKLFLYTEHEFARNMNGQFVCILCKQERGKLQSRYFKENLFYTYCSKKTGKKRLTKYLERLLEK